MNLLPCPHCGGEAELLIYGGGSYIIGCTKCRAHSGFYVSEETAATGWNKRVSPWKESAKEPPPKDGSTFLAIAGRACTVSWDGQRFALDGRYTINGGVVTHWMPIPLEASE